VPILAKSLAWIIAIVDLWVTQWREDLPMVLSRRPPLPGRPDEVLVRADAGIAQYRRLLHRALRQAGERLEAWPAHVRTQMVEV
jgi:hypothetical protein